MAIKIHLFVEVIVELFPGDLHVCVGVDLLEDVDGRGSLGDVEELDVEVEGGSPWDHLTGSLIAIAKLWRDDQLPFLAHAHANDTLVPTLDHLKRKKTIAQMVFEILYSMGVVDIGKCFVGDNFDM